MAITSFIPTIYNVFGLNYDSRLLTLKNILDGGNELANHGYFHKDHAKMNVTRRTCGYLGENFWNVGKTKEV